MGMMSFMQGHLTYTLAVIAILWGVVGIVSGFGDTTTDMEAVWGGLAVFGLRRAIN